MDFKEYTETKARNFEFETKKSKQYRMNAYEYKFFQMRRRRVMKKIPRLVKSSFLMRFLPGIVRT